MEAANKTYYLVRNGAMYVMGDRVNVLPRMLWRLANRGRLVYHKWRGSDVDIVEGLGDALAGVTGKKV